MCETQQHQKMGQEFFFFFPPLPSQEEMIFVLSCFFFCQGARGEEERDKYIINPKKKKKKAYPIANIYMSLFFYFLYFFLLFLGNGYFKNKGSNVKKPKTKTKNQKPKKTKNSGGRVAQVWVMLLRWLLWALVVSLSHSHEKTLSSKEKGLFGAYDVSFFFFFFKEHF